MDMTYKVEHKKMNTFVGILLILGILACIFMLTFILYLLNQVLHFSYMFLTEFILIISIVIIVARKQLIEFSYYLSGDILRIDRIYSARPKLDLFIRMESILYVGKLSTIPEKYKHYKRQIETFKRVNEDTLCVVHLVENKYFTAVLTPSEAFEQALIKAWKDYTYRSKKKK